MKVSIEDLQRYQVYLAKAIHNRSDGDFYIPIFQRLEQEIQDRLKNQDAMSRVRALASAY